jgi:1-acyl-sn-glycerol-3-phosphate acyltransferase
METLLRTTLGLLVLPPALVLYSLIVIAGALRGASAAHLDRYYVGFARLCLRVAGTRLEVHGIDQIEPGQIYVVVTNHESAWDAPSIVAGLSGLVLRHVAKAEIMRIPIFGHALRLTGNVTVTRMQTELDASRLRQAMARRDPNASVVFFAEGTRSRDGALHAFKLGAFATALEWRLPILPVAIAGTYAIWPKGTLRLRPGPVVLEVGEPIPLHGLSFDDRRALRDRVHEIVAKLRARARARLRARGFDPGGID